ncbi:MAG: winged helix-turn-helix domain-containing protein [Flavobacteriales bacterium]|nr:winged helix-turn-helix domain-containing protein [Flavobacteriales bacterium]
MMNRLIFGLLSVLVFAHAAFAEDKMAQEEEEQHIEVSMRMIGHQVLLRLGDSASRVLPIGKNENSYTISFATEFGFNPDDLASVIDSVIAATGIAKSYIVEFKSCDSNLVVHSYEVGISEHENVLACRERDQPKACYNLVVTILKPAVKTSDTELIANTDYGQTDRYIVLALMLICVLLPMVVVQFLMKKKPVAKPEVDLNIIPIGEYKFNKRKMELWFKDERIELTSKECDLLQLLCDSTNNTVERETILKMVWGDEGDYVGRTLDVFISKLRKKLEGDSNIKITNVRGIGYRLVVDTQ